VHILCPRSVLRRTYCQSRLLSAVPKTRGGECLTNGHLRDAPSENPPSAKEPVRICFEPSSLTQVPE
jgi:hypothetical protein